MAYVAPNGTIQLFRSVMLTPDYTDTIWFPNVSTQASVFEAQVDYQFSNQMYTRVSGNKVRVHIVADEIRDCSYMRFQNIRNNKAKWFYAFIINIEYINEQVTEITYEIDEIQTWYFEGNSNNHFSKCFIERQHSITDDAGDNLQPEPVQCSEHICCNMQAEVLQSAGIGYVLSVGTATKSSNASGDLYSKNVFNGISSTVKYLYFGSGSSLISFLNACEFANGLIKGLLNANDFWCPLTLYLVPTGAFTLSGTTAHTLFGDVTMLSESVKESTFSVSMPTYHGFGVSSKTKYTPINQKLFTYPYTYLEIETPLKSQEYKYETFISSTKKFKWYSVCNPSPAILIAPEMYNGISNDYRYSMTIEDFPQLQIYSSGMWGAAGNGIGSAVKVGAAMLLSASTGVYADLAGVGDMGSIPQTVIETGKRAIKNVPDIRSIPDVRSTGGTSNLAPILAPKTTQSGINNPIFSISANQWGLRKEYAQKIDEFFSRYGYAQNTVDVPNVHARSKWTYVKTRDCRCTVNAPASSLAKINNIMNEGITWWDFRTSVGSYGDFTNPIA